MARTTQPIAHPQVHRDPVASGRRLVSIGLPVYNGARHLEAAIDAILHQTYREIELIIADNASEDETREICERAARRDPRVRYIRHSKNVGASENFNFVYREARGQYFKWAAHDDLIHPDFVAACVERLEANPDVVLCHSEVEWIDENGAFLRDDDPDLEDVGDMSPATRFRNLILSEHFCLDVFGLIRREVLGKTPLIAPYIGSDRPLLAELGLRGRFERVPRALFQSRDHPGRSIRSMSPWKRGAWFAPRLADKLTMPYWRQLSEYIAAIRKVHLAPRERLACYLAIPPWILRNRRRLTVDLKAALGRLRTRLLGRDAGR